ncbi:MAG: ATPase, T2SS/T4P/T4SS family [Syntrophales bacterium]
MTKALVVNSRKQEEQIDDFQEILRLQKALQNVTDSIQAARGIRQILLQARAPVLRLFEAESLRIFIRDSAKNDLWTIVPAGNREEEIRLPVDGRSIPGFVAQARTAVNIADSGDRKELEAIHPELRHDLSAGGKHRIRSKQVMAAPILHDGEVLGVIEIAGRKGRSGRFADEEPVLLQEIAETLGIAFGSHLKPARSLSSRFSLLVEEGLISETDLKNSLEEAQRSNESPEEYLMKKMRISRTDIGRSLEQFYGCPFVAFQERPSPQEGILDKLRPEYLRRESWIPLEKAGGKIRVLVDDPGDILKKDTIQGLLKTAAVEYCVALKDDILKYIDWFYRDVQGGKSISEMISRLGLSPEDEDEEEDLVSESDSVIMQLVNKIIIDAASRRASDIHIEPSIRKKSVDVRFRIDGECVHYQSVPFSYRAAIVSRLKIMSNLDITERRLPQDGKIRFRKTGGEEMELRVATLPTQGSVEDVVLRILAKGETMPLEQMGLSPRNSEEFLRILSKPYGIVLVVGPTGSGKTTTLHAALRHINTPDMKIWTAEDPVEITQEGLRQVQINPKIGYDFSHAMRAFLRSDPDVIMVGEMRDFETAKIGVEASLTGHLVFSTLHTNSAPETIIRLLDMGIDPFNFADSLLGILAQRLVRMLCKKCREPYSPSPEEIEGLIHHYGEHLSSELNAAGQGDFRLYRPRGCSECDNTGFRGRMGIHELLVASERIKTLVARREPVEAIREAAVEEGMRTLLQDGIRKVLGGYTDFKQVLSVSMR